MPSSSDDETAPLAERWLKYKQLWKALLNETVKDLGEENAIRLWRSVSRDVLVNKPPGRKRGRPEDAWLKGWEMFLLPMLDAMSGPHRVRRLAQFMYENSKDEKGSYRYQSVEALEKQIRRRQLPLRKKGRLVKEDMGSAWFWDYKYTDILPPDGR
jgi:hypothetical protein